MPPGEISYIQASATTIGKTPIASSTTADRTHSGQSSARTSREVACHGTNAAPAYVAATR